MGAPTFNFLAACIPMIGMKTTYVNRIIALSWRDWHIMGITDNHGRKPGKVADFVALLSLASGLTALIVSSSSSSSSYA